MVMAATTAASELGSAVSYHVALSKAYKTSTILPKDASSFFR